MTERPGLDGTADQHGLVFCSGSTQGQEERWPKMQQESRPEAPLTGPLLSRCSLQRFHLTMQPWRNRAGWNSLFIVNLLPNC